MISFASFPGSACFILFFNLLNLFWHTDKNFCFYVEVNYWDFVRNDNSDKGTTARLNEIRFGPKKKSSPIYLGPKNLDTFWWNCQIILSNYVPVKLGFIILSLIGVLRIPEEFYLYKDKDKMREHSWPCRFHIIDVFRNRWLPSYRSWTLGGVTIVRHYESVTIGCLH